MSQPNNQVYIGFTLEVAGLGDFFTLDDPVKGLLDNTTYKLADAEVLVEVSEDVRSIRTRRGRSRELDKFNAGSLDIVLSNANRKYDPTNARATGTRQNLIPNPSFEAALTNWSTGSSFFTISATTRQNLMTNPSFEVGLDGWSGGLSALTGVGEWFELDDATQGLLDNATYTLAPEPLGATITRSTEQVYAGSFSGQATLLDVPSTPEQGMFFTLDNLADNTTYRISAYVYPEFGSRVRLSAKDITNNVTATPSAYATTQAWQRLDVTLTTGTHQKFVLDTDQLDTGVLSNGNENQVTLALTGSKVAVTAFELDSATNGLLDTGRLGADAEARFWVDAVMVEQTSDLNEYFDGTYRDPNLNDATSAWDGTTGLSSSTLTWANLPTISQDGSLARFGTNSAKTELFTRYAGQGIWSNVTGLLPSTEYTVSVYGYVQQGSAIKLSTRDTTNSISGTTSSTTSTAGWVRIDSTITTGASSPTVLVAIYTDANYLTSGAGPYSVFNIDAVLVEQTDSVKDYFDGSTADPAILLPVTSWAGTPNNSVSNLTFSIPGTGSPFFPDVVPRKQVKFTSNGQEVFDGVVDDWNFSYEIVGDATAQIIGTDAFSVISQTNIDPYSAPSETSSSRVSNILNRPEVNWPVAKRQIDTGAATLAAQDIGGTGASARSVPTLNYLQQVEQAEAGALFINKSGNVQFNSRTGSQGIPTIRFTDDGTGIPYIDVRIEYGTEEMRNRVSIYREGSNTENTAEDLTSIAAYGAFDYSINNSLLVDNSQATALAQYIVDKYANPRLRIDQISVVLNDITNGQVGDVLGLELGDGVEIVFTPEGIGDPIDQVVVIDSIEHNVSATSHVVTFNFSESSIGFILDDPVYGVLDTSELGF